MVRFGMATVIVAVLLIGALETASQAKPAAALAATADRAAQLTDFSAAKAKKARKKKSAPQPRQSGGSSAPPPAGAMPDRGMGGY